MNRLRNKDADSFVDVQTDRAAVVAPAMSASELSTIKVDQPFTLKTVALRWIRDCHEKPRGCPTHSAVELTRRDPLPVGILEDGTVGTHYRFKEANVKNGHGNRC